jgi:hypothetical protein
MTTKQRNELVKNSCVRVYESALDFRNSKTSVLIQIIAKDEKSQNSLFNIARQAVNRTSGFTRNLTNTAQISYDRQKICLYCQRAFRAKRSDQKFCKTSDRVRAYQIRKHFIECDF